MQKLIYYQVIILRDMLFATQYKTNVEFEYEMYSPEQQ